AKGCFQPRGRTRGPTAAHRPRAVRPRKIGRALMTADAEVLPSHAFDKAATPRIGNGPEPVFARCPKRRSAALASIQRARIRTLGLQASLRPRLRDCGPIRTRPPGVRRIRARPAVPIA